MGDLFRSAFNYISTAAQNVPGAGGGNKGTDHDMVGQTVEIGGLKLRIKYLIAEGGFGLVFAVTDTTNRWYALKRMLAADREQADTILHEIRCLRTLTGHPAIIQYVQAANLSPQESGHGRAEFLVLTELCSGGQIVQALVRQTFTPNDVCRVMNAACQAVRHMHSMDPPIIHRDLKGFVKLCDFGSATTTVHDVTARWSAAQRSAVAEELARFTTPMYRAPEMLDLYMNMPIGPPLDIWALGCILYYICYRRHPFEDSATLRIVNANYTLPDTPTPFTVFHPIINSCLHVSPLDRPTIDDLCERITVVAIALDVDLTKPAATLLPPDHKPVATPTSATTTPRQQPSAAAPPSRPPPPSRAPARPPPPSSEHHATALSSLSGKAGSLFHKMKDSGSKMVHQVQQTVSGKGPDMTYVTSRLVLCALPESLPDALWAPAEDQLKHALDVRHPDRHAVYNLGDRKMKHTYGGRLSEIALPTNARAPTLHALFTICDNMTGWLRLNAAHVCIVCGLEDQCATVITAMLLYTRLVEDPSAALYLLHERHRQSLHLSMGVLRYLQYTRDICLQRAELHSHSLTITGVRLSRVPLFNKAKSGCRPFIDIYAGAQRVFTSAQDYERMPVYDATSADGVDMTCGVIVSGDITIAVYHARLTLGGKVSATSDKYARIPICRTQWHTAFADASEECGELRFTLAQLDDTDDECKYGGGDFSLVVQYRVGEECQFTTELPPYWQYDRAVVSPSCAVTDKTEMDDINTLLSLDEQSSGTRPPPPPAHRPSTDARNAETGDFFTSLAWDGKPADNRLAPGAPPPIPTRSPSRSPALPRKVVAPPTAEECERNAESTNTLALSSNRRRISRSPTEHRVADKPTSTPPVGQRQRGIRVSAPDMSQDEPWNRPSAGHATSDTPADADLLNWSGGPSEASKSSSAADAYNPFAQFESAPAKPSTEHSLFADFTSEFSDTVKVDGGGAPDLLQDWSTAVLDKQSASNRASPHPSGQPFGAHLSAEHRNASAPHFNHQPQQVPRVPPSSARGDSPSNGAYVDAMLDDLLAQPDAATSSNGSTPSHQPNYGRSAFADIGKAAAPTPATYGGGKKANSGMFDDILTSQGFASTAPKTTGGSSIASMRRADEIADLTEDQIKIRDWTAGKERNIRALLSSMHNVLWAGAHDKWPVCSVGDLLSASQVKKCYFKACLVAHPDKQMDTPHHALAAAIFTELNDAYKEFENAGAPSLT